MSENKASGHDEIFIPKALKALNNWCVWKSEQRNGKRTKVPYIRTGKRASTKQISTWQSFDSATKVLENDAGKEFRGYGFMIADGLVFIDVDNCIAFDGCMDERGRDILSAFPLSYAEMSQSGRGIHILTRGEIPRCFNNRKCGVEMYSFGRFVALTGKALQEHELEPTEEQDGVTYVFNKYATHAGNISTYSEPLQTGISSRSDRWIISHASNITGQRGRDFRSLFDGDSSAYDSPSEADEALCVLLAFWCDRDLGQMDRIFRQSKLYRPKWERQDYRIRTLNHAVQFIPESLSEWFERNQREIKESASVKLFFELGGCEHGR